MAVCHAVIRSLERTERLERLGAVLLVTSTYKSAADCLMVQFTKEFQVNKGPIDHDRVPSPLVVVGRADGSRDVSGR